MLKEIAPKGSIVLVNKSTVSDVSKAIDSLNSWN